MRRALPLLAVLAVVALTACPPGPIVCRTGTIPCGNGCVDATSDTRNCGACGSPCGAGEVCSAGLCQCQSGTVDCGGACVVTSSDSLNCGGCGVSCDGGVCEGGTCKVACTLPFVRCGNGCIDANTYPTDPANCGGCGQACAQGQSCRLGTCTFDAVAACYSTGQAVGFNASTFEKAPLVDLASNPAALAVVPGGLLAVDGLDRRLYQAAITRAGLAQANQVNAVGAAPNQVLVDGLRVYVVNSGSGTLQVLLADGGAGTGPVALDAGVAAPLVLTGPAGGERQFGDNSYPEGVALSGGELWVPLYGGFGATGADAGQTVVRLTVSAGGVPTEVGRVDLKHSDLQRFDGGNPVARPWTVVAHRGAVYAVLNNLDPDTYAPEGPGLLARMEVDPRLPDGGPADPVTIVSLGGGSTCLNPQWAAEVGDGLAVSCGGKASYDPSTYALTGVTAAGLVLLDGQDRVKATWSSACPATGDAGCALFLPGRFAVRGQRLLLGDQNAGRVVVLDVTDAGLTEVRGVAQGLPLCPIGGFGVANVSDVVSVP